MSGIERVVAAILLAGAVAGAAAFAFMLGHTPEVTSPLGMPGRGAPGAVVIAPLPGLGVQAVVAKPAAKPGVPIPVLVAGAKPIRIARLVPVPRLAPQPKPAPAPRTKTPTPSPAPTPTPTPTPSPSPTPARPVPTPAAPSAPTPVEPTPPATPVTPVEPTPPVTPVAPKPPPVEVGGRELTPLPPTAVTMIPVVPAKPVAPSPPPVPAPPTLPITGTPSDGTGGSNG